jgi:CYTH domain-containing protein
MSQNLEIEKKFIIRYPDTKYLESLDDCFYSDIEQIYLAGEGKSERIRKRGLDGDFKYYHTVKYHLTDMTRVEEERLITKEEYDALKQKADPKLNVIYKKRYVFPYKNHVIEIDVFPFWKSQAYLEVELGSETEDFDIPPFIDVVCDVTLDKKYTNHSLAKTIPEPIV